MENKKSINTKTYVIIAIIVVALIIIGYLISSFDNSINGITIEEEQLVTTSTAIKGGYLYPILCVKVKNTSNKTKKVSFEANFYADGNLLGDDQASYVVLAPGDEYVLTAQSDRGYSCLSSHEYSYNITKWWIFDQ